MKNTVNTLLKQKQDGDKITMLTCYDYSTAKLMEEVGVNTILGNNGRHDSPLRCSFKRNQRYSFSL